MFDLKKYCLEDREGNCKKKFNRKERKEKILINKGKVKQAISFDENNLAELYSIVAYCVKELITDDKLDNGKEISISTTQFRKFYDKVLELNNKAKNIQEKEFNTKIKPMLSLLYSKVYYSVTRRQAGNNFKEIMFKCLNEVDSREKLERFKLFLEAIVGFMPKK